MVWVPAGNVETERDATFALTCELPSVFVPSMKLTLPVGDGAVVATPGAIVAESVTAPP